VRRQSGRHRTRIIRQRGHPPLLHYRCETCAHVFSRPLNDARAPRVLVVDDEASVRTFAARVLGDAGYEVVVASDGSDALCVVVQQAPFDLFVIDVAMPLMTGDELATQLRAVDPDVNVLYVTGYSDRLFNEASALREHEAFLDKPCSPQALLEAVSLLLFGHTRNPPSSTA
jgi:CheY-like chemotaxis protein